MNDVQTWTLIGGFLAILTVVLTWVQTSLKSEIRATKSELSADIRSVRDQLGGRLDTLSVRVDGLAGRIDSLEHRFEGAFAYRIKEEA